jgi:Holliday junction resolvase RusA-like endonuclease
MKFTLPMPPSANRNWKHTGRGVTLTDASRDYRDLCEKELLVLRVMHGLRIITGPVILTATVYRPRTTYDLHNTGKILLDVLEGWAYQNDNQIVEEHWYADDTDPKNPRVVISICRLDQANDVTIERRTE